MTGKLVEKEGWSDARHVFVASFAGLLVVYAVGMIYYYIIGNYVIESPIGIWALFLYCFLLAVPGDIFLCVLAALLTKRVKKSLMRDLR